MPLESPIRAELSTTTVIHSSDPRETEHVEVRSDRMWGYPTVAGTRVPTFRIAELFEAGLTPEEIREKAYPHITLEQIYGALTYEDVLKVTHTAENDTYYFTMGLDDSGGKLSTSD